MDEAEQLTDCLLWGARDTAGTGLYLADALGGVIGVDTGAAPAVAGEL